MIIHKKFILASSSASRKKILKNIGFPFLQVAPNCKEEKIKKELRYLKNKPTLIAKKLSYEKAKSISIQEKYQGIRVIGCDTLIYMNNTSFDKAKNIKEAKEKIKKLSGKKHKIVSGLTICKDGKKIWQCSEVTTVTLRPLSGIEINEYLKKTGSQILQSVGCYQIESKGPEIIEKISGDFFNVMGLPLFKLMKYVHNNK